LIALGLREDTRRWWVLTGASTGLFILMLDSTTLPLALPSIRVELGASSSGLQWVQNVYLLTMAALVITLGRLGDMLGRKRIFQLGLLGFGAGSVISATAGSVAQLIGGRVVQGAGGAALLALSLAIASVGFPPDERPRAMGIWAAVSAVALAIGPLVGGIAVELVSWRLIFWLVVPLAAVALVIMAVAAPESRDETAERRIDVLGLATLTSGLTAVVLALVQGKQWGWESAVTLGVLAGGLALLALFWVVEHRVREPIVDFRLFSSGPYFGATAAAFALVGSYWTLMFYLPQYVELVLDHSTLASGLLVVPVTAPMVVISPFDGTLAARLGARTLMTAGMACATAGLLVVTRVDGDTGYAMLLPGLLLFGIALGLVFATMSAAAMSALPSEKAGVASGVLAMNRTLAGAVLLAAGGAIFQHIELEDRLDGGSFDAAFADGLAGAAWLLAVVLAAGTLLTWLYVRSAPTARVVPSPAPHAGRRFHL
jgi:EmrB/QacA subfamily drug resistance transporter